jgi:hypothetical protein
MYKNLAPDHQPQIELSRSIAELKEGLESMGFKDEDFRNSKYIRLKVLSMHRKNGLLSDQLQWTKKSRLN